MKKTWTKKTQETKKNIGKIKEREKIPLCASATAIQFETSMWYKWWLKIKIQLSNCAQRITPWALQLV